jgi:hypothetical protein
MFKSSLPLFKAHPSVKSTLSFKSYGWRSGDIFYFGQNGADETEHHVFSFPRPFDSQSLLFDEVCQDHGVRDEDYSETNPSTLTPDAFSKATERAAAMLCFDEHVHRSRVNQLVKKPSGVSPAVLEQILAGDRLNYLETIAAEGQWFRIMSQLVRLEYCVAHFQRWFILYLLLNTGPSGEHLKACYDNLLEEKEKSEREADARALDFCRDDGFWMEVGGGRYSWAKWHSEGYLQAWRNLMVKAQQARAAYMPDRCFKATLRHGYVPVLSNVAEEELRSIQRLARSGDFTSYPDEEEAPSNKRAKRVRDQDISFVCDDNCSCNDSDREWQDVAIFDVHALDSDDEFELPHKPSGTKYVPSSVFGREFNVADSACVD